MILKGIVSAIYEDIEKVEVILPEYQNVVTRPLNIFGGSTSALKVNDFVLVIIFNDNFDDGLVFQSTTQISGLIDVIDSLESNSKNDALSANQGNVLFKMIQDIEIDEPLSNIEIDNILK